MGRKPIAGFPLAIVALAGCADSTDRPPADASDAPHEAAEAGDAEPREIVPPTVSEPEFVVPSAGLPAEVRLQRANNNLAVAEHDGRTYLAFRTAPTHFASAETVLYVVSTLDGTNWDLETSVALGTDLREPQLLSLGGDLFFYFAVLGTDPLGFDPQGMRVCRRLGPGEWTAPEAIYEPTFIPWRIRTIDGAVYLTGYTGGENIYEPGGDPIAIHFLTTTDGLHWEPVVPGRPVVLTGGGSETDFAFLADGSLVAVVRNEAGDESGFGSKICRARPEALADWECVHDPRKYDSPLVFRQGDDVWLVGRRHLAGDGSYDLGYDDLTLEEQYREYQLAYWRAPKRCSLWWVDPEALAVRFVLDLPSRGDTCLPDAIETEGRAVVYNYTSPLDGPDLDWMDGQIGPTSIYRVTLDFAE